MTKRQCADIKKLAEAMVDLLSASMFYYWLHNGEADEDQSWRECMDRARAALARIGFDHGSYEEFKQDLEAMLKSGMTPEEWQAQRQKDIRPNA